MQAPRRAWEQEETRRTANRPEPFHSKTGEFLWSRVEIGARVRLKACTEAHRIRGDMEVVAGLSGDH